MTELLVNSIAAVLTLMVLSRILGDNPIYRVAQYLFIGVSLGLAFVIVYHLVLRPAVVAVAAGSTSALWVYGVPLAAGLLLVPRITRRQQWSWLANIPLAVIFGVGTALAVGGAIIGTLFPQILDTARPAEGGVAEIAGVIVLALGTVITLMTFYYTTPRTSGTGRMIASGAALGHWLIMIAFGFFFASAIQTYMSALLERLQFLFSLFG